MNALRRRHHFEPPTVIPQMKYRYRPCGGSNKNRPVMIHYGKGPEFDVKVLSELKSAIRSTKYKYVHPLVYVDFVRSQRGIDHNTKMYLDPEELYKIREMSNYIRHRVDDKNEQLADFITYRIALKSMKHTYIVTPETE